MCKEAEVGEPLGQRQGLQVAVRRMLEKNARCTAMRCIPSTTEEGVQRSDLLLEIRQSRGGLWDWSERLQRGLEKSSVHARPQAGTVFVITETTSQR